MLIQLKKEFFLNADHIVSAEIIPLESNAFSVVIKSSSTNQGNKGTINIDFEDYDAARTLINKIKKALK